MGFVFQKSRCHSSKTVQGKSKHANAWKPGKRPFHTKLFQPLSLTDEKAMCEALVWGASVQPAEQMPRLVRNSGFWNWNLQEPGDATLEWGILVKFSPTGSCDDWVWTRLNWKLELNPSFPEKLPEKWARISLQCILWESSNWNWLANRFNSGASNPERGQAASY